MAAANNPVMALVNVIVALPAPRNRPGRDESQQRFQKETNTSRNKIPVSINICWETPNEPEGTPPSGPQGKLITLGTPSQNKTTNKNIA